jgi:hypothetical protein
MTVLTLPARPGHDITPPPVPWRRMVWVIWRQHRATMISVPAVLGALALFLQFIEAGWLLALSLLLLACTVWLVRRRAA